MKIHHCNNPHRIPHRGHRHTALLSILVGFIVLLGVAFGGSPVGAEHAKGDAANREATELNNRGVQRAQQGEFAVGVGLMREAVTLSPRDTQFSENLSGVLTDWAPILQRKGKVDAAIAVLEEAVELLPTNGKALVQLGDLYYYHQSEFDRAIDAWTQAHGQVPSRIWHMVADRISQAQRDQVIERQFHSHTTTHFDIRTQDNAQISFETLSTRLETEYAQLAQFFDGGPPTTTVIVYSQRDLERTYYQRDWAVGFYDGRLRLLDTELEGPFVRLLIVHELTHAFLHYHFGPTLPVWVHEGFAQVQEGKRPHSPEEAQMEERVRAGTKWIPLVWIDRYFQQPADTEDVQRAYVQARLVVHELIQRHGHAAFKAFLRALASGQPVDQAYDASFAPSRWSRANHGVYDE